MTTIRSSRELFGIRPDAVYDVLSFLEPGVMLDVGAAAGFVTQRMLTKSPRSTVIAFEPFPGNHPYLEERVGADDRVTIVKAAVADQTGPSTFFVGSTVKGTEPGWERYVGYSSVGFVVSDTEVRARTIAVPTARIDDYVDSANVRFMKIDVQGGELGVLKSARRALMERRIDLMFVEFGGDNDLLDFIFDAGFEVFDSEYLLVADETPDPGSWQPFRTGMLSLGRPYYRAWPCNLPTDPNEFCAMFRTSGYPDNSLYTDLVCVRSGFVDEYLCAAAAARDVAITVSASSTTISGPVTTPASTTASTRSALGTTAPSAARTSTVRRNADAVASPRMSRLLSSRPARRLLRPLRARLTAHSTRIARAEVEPTRRALTALTKRLDEQAAQLVKMRRQMARVTSEHADVNSRMSELLGRFEALRYRYEGLETSVPTNGASDVARSG